jgi:hypothetical protein
MFVCCNKCNWSQDDFYDETYNPAKWLKNWDNELFGEKRGELDKLGMYDDRFLTTREVIARAYERFARRIREMQWVTYQDFQNEPNKVCPRCGADKLDID